MRSQIYIHYHLGEKGKLAPIIPTTYLTFLMIPTSLSSDWGGKETFKMHQYFSVFHFTCFFSLQSPFWNVLDLSEIVRIKNDPNLYIKKIYSIICHIFFHLNLQSIVLNIKVKIVSASPCSSVRWCTGRWNFHSFMEERDPHAVWFSIWCFSI